MSARTDAMSGGGRGARAGTGRQPPEPPTAGRDRVPASGRAGAERTRRAPGGVAGPGGPGSAGGPALAESRRPAPRAVPRARPASRRVPQAPPAEPRPASAGPSAVRAGRPSGAGRTGKAANGSRAAATAPPAPSRDRTARPGPARPRTRRTGPAAGARVWPAGPGTARLAGRRTGPAAPAVPAASRTPFLFLVVGLLSGGLLSLLLINTILASGSYQITSLQSGNVALSQKVQELHAQIAQEESPSALARRAAGLGMVDPGLAHFINLRTGRIASQPATVAGVPTVPGYTP